MEPEQSGSPWIARTEKEPVRLIRGRARFGRNVYRVVTELGQWKGRFAIEKKPPGSCFPWRARNRSALSQLFLFVVITAFCRVKDYIEQATVNRRYSAVVVDKAKLPELVHEIIDA